MGVSLLVGAVRGKRFGERAPVGPARRGREGIRGGARRARARRGRSLRDGCLWMAGGGRGVRSCVVFWDVFWATTPRQGACRFIA